MASSGPFYPRGVYRGLIMDQGLSKAGTGTVQIVIRFKVLEAVQPVGDVSAQYERTAYIPVTEKSMEYLPAKLEALGYTRDSIRYFDLMNPQCHDLRGNEADFFCKHENDKNGDLREKWDIATGGSSKALELTPPDAQAVRNLDMLFARARKQTAATPARPAQRSPQAMPSHPGITDDDVPF
jgi:hypothetical protein